jgi:putative SOS response-associated peptidase YedK
MRNRIIVCCSGYDYKKYFDLLPEDPEDLARLVPDFTVAPNGDLEVVIIKEGLRSVVKARWGLVPGWTADSKIHVQTDVEGERLVEGPSFREAFTYKRCIVPARGYYEWHEAGSQKQPRLFRLRGELEEIEPFAFAGVMATNDSLHLATFAIVTLKAEPPLNDVHPRTPVILDKTALDVWLDPRLKISEACCILEQNRAADLVHQSISPADPVFQFITPEPGALQRS